MTEVERICVSFRDQSANWSWESVIPQHKGRGERIATASVRTGFAMTGFFTRGAVQARFGPSRTPSPMEAYLAVRRDMVIVYTLYFYIQKSERKHEL